MKSHLPTDPIDEQAARWALELDRGEIKPEEGAAFSTWINANPEHRSVFEEYRRLSSQLEAHIEVRLGAAVDETIRARTLGRRWGRGLTAAVALAVFVAGLASLANRPAKIATGIAERRTVVLDDGSTVDLNAQSALVVNLRRDRRQIRLIRGEALFHVAKDSQRPFIVETQVGSVRAVGTVFDVRATALAQVEVTVLEGSVRVRKEGDQREEQTAATDQQVVVSPQAITVHQLAEGAARVAIAWCNGQVVFDETPLNEVVERFSAYHARDIVVEPGAGNLRLGGRYSLADLDGLLDSIGRLLPVRVTAEAGHRVRIAAMDSPDGPR